MNGTGGDDSAKRLLAEALAVALRDVHRFPLVADLLWNVIRASRLPPKTPEAEEAYGAIDRAARLAGLLDGEEIEPEADDA